MFGDQASQAFSSKALGPTLDIRSAATQCCCRPTHSGTIGQRQDDSSALRILRTRATRTHPALQFLSFYWSQHNRFVSHEPISPEAVAHVNVTLQ